MSDYGHLELPQSVVEYTRNLDNECEKEGKTDTCDVCKNEFQWKELNWFGGTSCRICKSSSCRSEMNQRWKDHCDEMEAEREMRQYDDDWDY